MGEPRPGHSKYLRRGYLAPTERVRFETHPSRWFYFFYPSLLFILSIFLTYAAAAGIWTRLPRVPWVTDGIARLQHATGHLDWFGILFGLGALFLLGSIAWITVRRTLVWPVWTYVITDDRMIQQYGLIRHDFQEIPLRQVRDVVIRQDWFWDRVRGFGTIQFHSLSSPDESGLEPPKYEIIRNPWLYPSPRDPNFSRWQERVVTRILGHPIPPQLPRALAGVEWWGGVPAPLRIQREVELALRRGYGADSSVSVKPAGDGKSAP